MLDPVVFTQIILAVVLGELVIASVKPVATGLKKGIKMLAKKIAD